MSEKRSGARTILQYTFETGGSIQLLATGDVATIDALYLLDVLLTIKRREMAVGKEKGDD